jgi:hypothetical protein
MLDFNSNSQSKTEFLSSRDPRETRDTSPAAPAGLAHSSAWAPLFTGALLFVGAVSFYDGYLVVRTGDMIEDFEKNPVGLYLLRIDNGSPSIFLRVKAAGTILVLTGLSFLHRRSKRMAVPIAFALSVFQTGLLIFLEGPFT